MQAETHFYIKITNLLMTQNIYLAEDNEFSLRLINNGYKIRFIPDCAVYHHECGAYSFLRKLYCQGYYYSNMFIKGKSVKTTEQTLFQFLPLIGVSVFLILIILFPYFKLNILYLLILPLFIILILIKEALTTSKKLKKQRIKGFFFIFYIFCLFCMVWVISSFLGLTNIQIKKVQDLYKHY